MKGEIMKILILIISILIFNGCAQFYESLTVEDIRYLRKEYEKKIFIEQLAREIEKERR